MPGALFPAPLPSPSSAAMRCCVVRVTVRHLKSRAVDGEEGREAKQTEQKRDCRKEEEDG